MNSAVLQHLVIALVGTVAIVAVVRFEVLCLTDLARADDAKLRYLTRRGWIAACLLTIPIGGILYLCFGRAR